jgi:hypothetical protein
MVEKKTNKQVQTGGSLGNIHTGSAKTNPGVLKAKADKIKATANITAYKIKNKK